MVVGQDWGTTTYFLKWEGIDQRKGNPTNDNLRLLLKSIGIDIGTGLGPTAPQLCVQGAEQ
jgi:hypothetical protein